MRCIVFLSMLLLFAMAGPLAAATAPGTVPVIATPDQAAAVVAKAMEDLRAGDRDQDRNIAAALGMTAALTWYLERGDTARVTELQAFIYWCKKRMDADALRALIAAKNAGVQALTRRMEAVVNTPVEPDQCEAWYQRALAYERSAGVDPLAIAMRWFEVADRFAGQPRSLEAQRRSLEFLKKSNTAAAASDDGDVIAKELKAQLAVPPELPDEAKAVIAASNAAVERITASASKLLDAERAKAQAGLAGEIEATKRRGDLDGLILLQRQTEDLDEPVDGVTKRVAFIVETYGKARERIVKKAADDVGAERQRLRATLSKVQADAVRLGNLAGAQAIRSRLDQLTAKPVVAAGKARSRRNEVEITVQATGAGVPLDLGGRRLPIGTHVIFTFVSGTWSFYAGGRRLMSPDDLVVDDKGYRLVVRDESGNFIAEVPGQTARDPFHLVLDRQAAAIVLDQHDSPDKREDNEGAVVYRIRILLPDGKPLLFP